MNNKNQDRVQLFYSYLSNYTLFKHERCILERWGVDTNVSFKHFNISQRVIYNCLLRYPITLEMITFEQNSVQILQLLCRQHLQSLSDQRLKLICIVQIKMKFNHLPQSGGIDTIDEMMIKNAANKQYQVNYCLTIYCWLEIEQLQSMK